MGRGNARARTASPRPQVAPHASPVALVVVDALAIPEEEGALPSIACAAQARGRRIGVVSHGSSWSFWPRDSVESSELGPEGRRCIRRWASGQMSGQQCLLRLELSAAVTELLGKEPAAEAEETEEQMSSDVPLWSVGCIKLGGAEKRLEGLRKDLEGKSPSQVFQDAYEAVVKESGGGGEDGDESAAWPAVDDVNWERALGRISRKAWRKVGEDPCPFVRAQLWRDVVRVSLGAGGTRGPTEDSDAEEPEDIGWGVSSEREDGSDDAAVLRRLRQTEEELRHSSKDIPLDRLQREGKRLLEYVSQSMQMAAWLREALESWQRFDAYRIIGVKRGCTKSQLRRAFYKKALLVHPDKGGDKAAFQELQRAYDEIVRELDGLPPAGEDDDENEDADSANGDGRGGDKDDPGKKPTSPTAASEAGREQGEQEVPASAAGEEPKGKDQGQLGVLAKQASEAAEAAGERAFDVLRLCRAAREALEDRAAQIQALGRERAREALVAARAVAEAGRRVAKITGRVSAVLSSLASGGAAGAVRALGLEGTEASPLERAALVATEAAAAANWATGECSRAAADVDAVLQELSGGEGVSPCGEEVPPAQLSARLSSAVGGLARASKQLAVASLDAAEAAADAATTAHSHVDAEDLHGLMSEMLGEESAIDLGGDDPEAQAKGEQEVEAEECEKTEAAREGESEVEDEEARKARLDDAREARRQLEVHQALSTVLEAVRMLRCTNLEILRLQRSAQDVTSRASPGKSGGLLPAKLAERRRRAFALLAEFLDEAALGFQEAVTKILGEAKGDAPMEDVLLRIASESLAFVLRSSPELAVPLDPRAQALRAAVALDATAAREMLQTQLPARLQNALMAAQLDAACLEAAANAPPVPSQDAFAQAGADAVEKLRARLAEALARLKGGSCSSDAAQ